MKLDVTEIQWAVLVSVDVTVALSGARLARLTTLRLATWTTLVTSRLILARRATAADGLAEATAAWAMERREGSAEGSAVMAANATAQSLVSVYVLTV